MQSINGTILAFYRSIMNVILLFYRNFLWFANFISLFGCLLIWAYGGWQFAIAVFWTKVGTNILLGLYVELFQHEQFYFFYNLGYSKMQLYSASFLLDMLIWFLQSLITIEFFL
jgi:hypothetical protein